MLKKRFVIILAVFLLLTALIGCSGGSAKKEGEITIWWPGGSDAESAAVYSAKDLYEAANPGVTINIVPQTTSNFYMQYMLSLLGNDYPDIAYVDHVYVQQLAASGDILNLSENGYDSLKDTFLESLWTPNSYQGSTYALPMSANVLVTAYNKTLLETVIGHAITEDDIPSNYSEFKTVADQILAYNTAYDTDYYPTTIPAGNGNESMAAMTFLSYAARFGGNILSDDLSTVTLTTDSAFSAAQRLAEIGQAGYTTNTFSEGLFEGGKVAFIEMGPWKITDYSRLTQEIDYAPVMSLTDDGQQISTLGLYSLVVTKQSPNAALAADFVSFITTSDELQLLHNTSQNLMPTTLTALADDYYSSDLWNVFKTQLENVVARPGSEKWSEIENYLAEYVTSLIAGSRDDDYLYTLQYAIQELIDD